MYFTVEKLTKLLPEIRAAISRYTRMVPSFKYLPENCEGAHLPDFDDSGWKNFLVGDRWGGYDSYAWFRAQVEVPQGWRQHKLYLRLVPGPRDGYGSTAEAQLYINGYALQGIDVWHAETWLPEDMISGGGFHLALHAWSGMYRNPPQRRFAEASLIYVDEATESFFYLADTLLKAAKQFEVNDYRHTQLLNLLSDSFHQINFFEPKTEAFYQSVAQSLQFLSAGLADLPKGEMKPSVNAIGHSHIDMMWMWQSKHTREKAHRTFSTMLHLMRQYPEFQFIHSSPQLYKFVMEDDPLLYECIKERINAGQWEITGGMWVESDTNLPNGESLVRQILFGKRFIQKEFGKDCTVLWMPDTFGFSWVLPQLMKKSGLKYFASSAIHWSRFTRFPHDTFHWRGMDGSQVLVTFFTAPGETIKNHYNYNGLIAPYDLKVAWEHYRQKEINDELLMPFGWGDGGGGPTREMIEAVRVEKDIPGFAYTRIGKVEPYFERLEARLEGKDVPLYVGELYSEGTHGVYTSQARNKRANRKTETLLHDAELMNSLVVSLGKQADYPQTALNSAWEKLLHVQFHDVLPGTSIHQVMEDSLLEYEKVKQVGNTVLNDAINELVRNIPCNEESLIVINPLPWERNGCVEVDAELLKGRTVQSVYGTAKPSQTVIQADEKKELLEVDGVPSWGYRVYPLVSAASEESGNQLLIVTPDHLENDLLRIDINEYGQLQSIFDKRNGREVLQPGSVGNALQLFEDRDAGGEAWEVNLFYQDKTNNVDNLVERVVEETGPLRVSLRLTWEFGQSRLTQCVRLKRHSARIDFVSDLNWIGHQMLLKTAFPLDLRATHATYEIQFGNIDRPAHWNTPYDLAHYENPAQKWVDFSEGGYGVALLNDCKYGYDVKDSVMRLTLHRSPTDPDENADQGHDHFVYALLPHEGTWRNSQVAREAYELNDPLLLAISSAKENGELPAVLSWTQVNVEHVILETLKKAEDDDAWIVRLYEYQQKRNPAVHLNFHLPIRNAAEVNLLEAEPQPVQIDGTQIIFPIEPYEIKTFKIWL